MRYNEFKEKIEDWGQKHGYVTEVTVHDFHTYVEIEIDEESHYIASISDIYMFELDTGWKSARKIKNHARGELFDILVEYARTPVEERKKEKYYLRLSIFGYDDEQNYLNLERDTGKYLFGSKKDIEGYQTQFSQKEIDEMKKKYNLDSFEIVEVEE